MSDQQVLKLIWGVAGINHNWGGAFQSLIALTEKYIIIDK